MKYNLCMRNIIELFSDMFSHIHSKDDGDFYSLNNTGKPVFNYAFLMNLDEKEYPKYLSEIFFIKFGKKLNLKHPKTINEKIQWLKLYDNLPIKTQLTDKVLVRDWIKEKIGEEYLKPVLWIGDKFNEVPFDILPKNFIIKCNQGCKWHIIIKDKDKFLENKELVNCIRELFGVWLPQSYFGYSDFETHYKNIEPKMLIELLLPEDGNDGSYGIEVWCFNGQCKIIQKYKRFIINKKIIRREISSYDENFTPYNIRFLEADDIIQSEPNEILKQAAKLSEILAKDFKFVRVDWMVSKNKLYFEEMTFTPYSGFISFPENNSKLQLKLGKMLNLKGDKHAS